MSKKIVLNLIVVSHPDDEILGFGATGYKAILNGEDVQPVILCGHVDARTKRPTDLELLKNIDQANYLVGFKKPVLGNFPNLSMNTTPHLSIVKFIEEQIIKYKPQRIFTHHPNDLNDDHKQVSNACMAASRLSQRNSSYKAIQALFFMEILSSSEWSYDLGRQGFNPNIFVDISSSINKKIESLKCYKNVMRNKPHPRSVEVIKALATFRGSQIGYDFAEAFQLAYQREI